MTFLGTPVHILLSRSRGGTRDEERRGASCVGDDKRAWQRRETHRPRDGRPGVRVGGGGSASRDSYLIIQRSEATVVVRRFTTDFVWGDG